MNGESEVEVFSVMDWIRDVVCGCGGFQDFEKREGAFYSDRDIALAEFVVRALANPSCNGSDDMVSAIIERRKEVQGSRGGEAPRGASKGKLQS